MAPDFDLINLTKITLVYFRAKVLLERMMSQPKQVHSQSWEKWRSSKNVTQQTDVSDDDITDNDVASVAKILTPYDVDPDRLYELFRQFVATTSGVEMTLIRAAICHALTSSKASHGSIDKFLNHFLTLEDVEDGELLSDEEGLFVMNLLL